MLISVFSLIAFGCVSVANTETIKWIKLDKVAPFIDNFTRSTYGAGHKTKKTLWLRREFDQDLATNTYLETTSPRQLKNDMTSRLCANTKIQRKLGEGWTYEFHYHQKNQYEYPMFIVNLTGNDCDLFNKQSESNAENTSNIGNFTDINSFLKFENQQLPRTRDIMRLNVVETRDSNRIIYRYSSIDYSLLSMSEIRELQNNVDESEKELYREILHVCNRPGRLSLESKKYQFFMEMNNTENGKSQQVMFFPINELVCDDAYKQIN